MNNKDIALIKCEILEWMRRAVKKTVNSFEEPTSDNIKIEEYLWKYLDYLEETIDDEQDQAL